MSTKPKPKRAGLFGALAALFGALKEEGGAQLATHVLEDDTNLIVVDETQQVFYLTDDNLIGEAVPDGEHLLKDGQTLVVTDGKLAELKPAESAEDTEPAAEDTEVVDATTEELAKAAGTDGAKLTAALKSTKLGLHKTGDKIALTAGKLQLTEAQKLSVLMDSNNVVIWVEPTDGTAWEIGDDLYRKGPLAPGTYTLQDESQLVVFERTEEFESWDGTTMTITRSHVNFPESTVAVETLIPWLKETMSAITQATEKLTASNAEIAKLKAENATLKKQPAAKPVTVPPSTLPKPESKNPRIQKRDARVRQALQAIDRIPD